MKILVWGCRLSAEHRIVFLHYLQRPGPWLHTHWPKGLLRCSCFLSFPRGCFEPGYINICLVPVFCFVLFWFCMQSPSTLKSTFWWKNWNFPGEYPGPLEILFLKLSFPPQDTSESSGPILGRARGQPPSSQCQRLLLAVSTQYSRLFFHGDLSVPKRLLWCFWYLLPPIHRRSIMGCAGLEGRYGYLTTY